MAITIIDSDSHEEIYRVEDPSVGLLGFIAIHSTTLGPAAGGLRMKPYCSSDEALKDVKRLSEGMTYKNAAAGLSLGGGKAVIMGDPAKDKSPNLLRSFARALNTLNGRYITAEDMGMSPDDMAVIAEETPNVAGLASGTYASGDPSPITAQGIFNALKITHAHKYGTNILSKRRVAVQGLGHVGWYLCELLTDAGAELIVCDINDAHVEQAIERFGCSAVPTSEIYSVDADIFSPCAIGGVLNSETIPQLKVAMVVGGANNQLATPEDGRALHERGILYAPDFVANGGGIINVATEIQRISDRSTFVSQKLSALEQTLTQILRQATAENVSPDAIAIATVSEKMAKLAA
ncbi:Glu/Leu/Phe/Val family dehydrogenase [Epibacterium ulvae]|uniref:Glu/Leu/Phe/Val family dehydrogenase n=1 Tax=Epibacterium ulvae TaxID=1156985 RepID=UPI00248F8B91|nr:Glu/Leu/Phe/Val dehydrogenase dimerization domain-containing protein [Epibacterium ulvae]